MKPRLIVAALALLAPALALGASQDRGSAQTAVPVRDEPMHHLLFENEDVRAFDVIVPPGGATLFHVHALDYVYVVLGDAALESQILGQSPANLPVKSGEVRFTPGPVTHRVVNVGTSPFHNITVELVRPRQANPSAPRGERDERSTRLPPLPAASKERIVLENDRLRATRLALEPGLTAQTVTLPARTLVVALTEGSLRADVRGEEPRTVQLHPGTALWHAEPHTVPMANTGKSPIEIIEITLK